MGTNDYYNKLLADTLSGQLNNTHPKVKLRVTTRRTKHSERFAERVQKNAELADQLIDVIKALNRKQGTENQVEQLIDIAKDLLDNNSKLREQVGEALQDIPPNG